VTKEDVAALITPLPGGHTRRDAAELPQLLASYSRRPHNRSGKPEELQRRLPRVAKSAKKQRRRPDKVTPAKADKK